ncbi:acyl carrier protein [Rhodospirillum sp. A1_3_36]|uniref:acyl carrier protein n=1 Tax=Rhodospirillum sp. A1_3_36 TaxID=3391666 RepID=UPI0039A5C666
MRDDLIAVVADFVDVDPAELDDSMTLEDLKIDSLTFVEIMFEVEEKYDVPVLSEMQGQRLNLRDLGDVLRMTEALIRKQQNTASSAGIDVSGNQ